MGKKISQNWENKYYYLKVKKAVTGKMQSQNVITCPMPRRNNNWKNATVRLITLRKISTLDLWKDVVHGKKTQFNRNALEAWKFNMTAENVVFREPARWTTVDNQALKWVTAYASQESLKAKQTGHGDDSEDSGEEHPSLTTLSTNFRNRLERNEYVALLNDLDDCLSSKQTMLERKENQEYQEVR